MKDSRFWENVVNINYFDVKNDKKRIRLQGLRAFIVAVHDQ